MDSWIATAIGIGLLVRYFRQLVVAAGSADANRRKALRDPEREPIAAICSAERERLELARERALLDGRGIDAVRIQRKLATLDPYNAASGPGLPSA